MFSMMSGASNRRRGFDRRRGGDVDDGPGGGCRLPAGREQGTEVVLIGHGRQPLKDVGEVKLGVVAVAAGAFHQGEDDGGTLAGGLAAHEEPVLFSYGDRSNTIFYPVVIDFKLAVAEVEREPVPQFQRVIDGFAQLTLGQHLGALAQGDEVGFEDLEQRSGPVVTEACPFCRLRGGAGLPEGGFDLVDLLDGGQRTGRQGLAGFEGIVELAPGVRPAGKEDDAFLVGSPGVVAGIGVGLQEALVITQQVVKAGGLATGMPLIEDVPLDPIARSVDDPQITGGCLALAGIEIADGRLVPLKVITLQQAAVEEFVNGLDCVGHHLVPVAQGVAGNVHTVAHAQDALGAVVRPVMAVFGGHDVGHHAGRGAETQRGWRGHLDGRRVGLADGDMHDAHDTLDEDPGWLIVEPVGDDPFQLAVGCRIGLDLVLEQNRLAHFEVREIARLAGSALRGGRCFSRRSWVCGNGGGRFFCRIGIQQEFELGGIERLALFVEELPKDLVDALVEQLVFEAQARDLVKQLLFALGSHYYANSS